MKMLKIVGLFMAITLTVIVGGLSIYLLIENNRTYYIYDVRIVEPIGGYHVYTDSGKEDQYVSLKNKTVYMTNSNENKFEVGFYVHTSIDTQKVNLSSSDESVAYFNEERDGRCFVYYLKAGVAELTAEVGGVKDSFTLTIYDNIPESFIVFDNAYYGNYNENFPNKIVCYADNKWYRYNFAVSSLDSETNVPTQKTTERNTVDSELLQVDKSTIDISIFDKAEIDPYNRTLNLKCNSVFVDKPIMETVDTTIVVQSFYYEYNGNTKVKKINKNYVIAVHVVADNPEYLQMVMSTTPDFEDDSVYVYTDYYPRDLIENYTQGKDNDLLENSLSNQKEISYLSRDNEMEVYKAYFTEKVSKIYIRFRKVYTNGNIVYLNPLTIGDNPFSYDLSDSQYFKLSANENYYVLTINKDDPEFYFRDEENEGEIDENKNFTIKLSIADIGNFKIEPKIFYFAYRNYTTDNLLDFYRVNEEKGIFEFYYWDPRIHYDNEIFNADGNIVGFEIDGKLVGLAFDSEGKVIGIECDGEIIVNLIEESA